MTENDPADCDLGPDLDSPLEVIATDGELNCGPIDKTHNKLNDKSTIFLTYLSFLGDEAKTAAALNTSVEVVAGLAKDEGWRKRVDALIALRREQGADALAKELNRVANFVQAVRLRNMLDTIIRRVTSSRRSFDDFLTANSKHASNVSFKPLTELVKSVEMVHKMSYAALGDALTERLASQAEDKGSAVSAAVVAALAVASHGDKGDPMSGARAAVVSG